MDSREKQRQYEDYIADVSPMAAAIGRRVPYHLEYLRRYGDIKPGAQPGKEDMADDRGEV